MHKELWKTAFPKSPVNLAATVAEFMDLMEVLAPAFPVVNSLCQSRLGIFWGKENGTLGA